jgi:hypothetical protein
MNNHSRGLPEQEPCTVLAVEDLPGSMNGVELARRVATDFPNLKLLMTSSRAPAHVFAATQPFIRSPMTLRRSQTAFTPRSRPK